MELIINGKNEEFDGDRITIEDILKLKEVKEPNMMTIGLNGSFVERKEYGTRTLRDGDSLELIYFVGGG